MTGKTNKERKLKDTDRKRAKSTSYYYLTKYGMNQKTAQYVRDYIRPKGGDNGKVQDTECEQ